MSKDRLLSDEELKKECLARVALQEYGTTPSNLSGEQLGKIGFASVDLYQFINTQKRLYAESVIGANQPMPKRGDTDPDIYVEVIHRVEGRNALRAEQRRRIKQMTNGDIADSLFIDEDELDNNNLLKALEEV